MFKGLTLWWARRKYEVMHLESRGCFCKSACHCVGRYAGVQGRSVAQIDLLAQGYIRIKHKAPYGADIWVNDATRMKVIHSHEYGR